MTISTTRDNGPTTGGGVHFSKRPHPSNPITLSIIKDLQNDKLIDNLDRMSFTLSSYGMTVNGYSQPEEIFQHYKSKYIKHLKDHVRYSQSIRYSGGSSSEDVVVDD